MYTEDTCNHNTKEQHGERQREVRGKKVWAERDLFQP